MDSSLCSPRAPSVVSRRRAALRRAFNFIESSRITVRIDSSNSRSYSAAGGSNPRYDGVGAFGVTPRQAGCLMELLMLVAILGYRLVCAICPCRASSFRSSQQLVVHLLLALGDSNWRLNSCITPWSSRRASSFNSPHDAPASFAWRCRYTSRFGDAPEGIARELTNVLRKLLLIVEQTRLAVGQGSERIRGGDTGVLERFDSCPLPA